LVVQVAASNYRQNCMGGIYYYYYCFFCIIVSGLVLDQWQVGFE